MLGERLKTIRGKRSQADFAVYLGVCKNTYVRYERGRRIPDAQFVGAICRKMDLSPAWLLLGEGAPIFTPAGTGATAEEKSKMQQVFSKLDGYKTYIGAGIAGAGYAAKMLGADPAVCDGIMGFGALVAVVGIRMAVNKAIGGSSEKTK